MNVDSSERRYGLLYVPRAGRRANEGVPDGLRDDDGGVVFAVAGDVAGKASYH